MSEYSIELRDFTVSALEHMPSRGEFDDQPEGEEDFDFAELSGEDLKWYYENWVETEED